MENKQKSNSYNSYNCLSDEENNKKITNTRILSLHLENFNENTEYMTRNSSFHQLFQPLEPSLTTLRIKSFEIIIKNLDNDEVINDENPKISRKKRARSNSLGENIEIIWDFNRLYPYFKREKRKVNLRVLLSFLNISQDLTQFTCNI